MTLDCACDLWEFSSRDYSILLISKPELLSGPRQHADWILQALAWLLEPNSADPCFPATSSKPLRHESRTHDYSFWISNMQTTCRLQFLRLLEAASNVCWQFVSIHPTKIGLGLPFAPFPAFFGIQKKQEREVPKNDNKKEQICASEMKRHGPLTRAMRFKLQYKDPV